MSSFISLYDILRVPREASPDEIKTAFRMLAKIHHPDKNRNSPDSEIRFIHLHNAYTVLSDPVRKQEYDNYLGNSHILKKKKSRSDHLKITTDRKAPFSTEILMSHINYMLWDIEILLNGEYKKYCRRKIGDLSVREHLLKMLTFIDQWILFPSGYHDYFMEARKMESMRISDYLNIIGTGKSGMKHKPFYNTVNYFYDIRKRMDKFMNSVVMRDLFEKISDHDIRLIDSILETQNYIIHYLAGLNMAFSGTINEIKPFNHSNSCFYG